MGRPRRHRSVAAAATSRCASTRSRHREPGLRRRNRVCRRRSATPCDRCVRGRCRRCALRPPRIEIGRSDLVPPPTVRRPWFAHIEEYTRLTSEPTEPIHIGARDSSMPRRRSVPDAAVVVTGRGRSQARLEAHDHDVVAEAHLAGRRERRVEGDIVRSGLMRPGSCRVVPSGRAGGRGRSVSSANQRGRVSHDIVGDVVEGAALVVLAPPSPVVTFRASFVEFGGSDIAWKAYGETHGLRRRERAAHRSRTPVAMVPRSSSAMASDDQSMFAPQIARCATSSAAHWDERGFGDTGHRPSPTGTRRRRAALLDELALSARFAGCPKGVHLASRRALAPNRVKVSHSSARKRGPRRGEQTLYEAMVEDWTTNGPHDSWRRVASSSSAAATTRSVIASGRRVEKRRCASRSRR